MIICKKDEGPASVLLSRLIAQMQTKHKKTPVSNVVTFDKLSTNKIPGSPKCHSLSPSQASVYHKQTMRARGGGHRGCSRILNRCFTANSSKQTHMSHCKCEPMCVCVC